MKIGYFTSLDGWGGSETYLLALIKGVRESGHDVTLYGVEGTRLFHELSSLGVRCIPWKNSSASSEHPNVSEPLSCEAGDQANAPSSLSGACWRSSSPTWIKMLSGNLQEVLLLRRLFAENRIDVMHVAVHGYEVAGVACRLVGIPCVAMNMITPPTERYWFRRWMMRTTAKLYNIFSSQSAYCTEVWRKFAQLNPKRCAHIWSSVDLDLYPSARIDSRDWNSSPLRLVSLGRLHPMKGYSYLIQAMNELKDDNIVLEILGEGSQREELEGLIRCYGLEDRILLPGHVENVVDHLLSAHCFVLASVSHESCPAVLSEAMAAGLPLITSDFGPLAEINRNEETGVVIPMHSSEGLARAIRLLAINREDAQAKGLKGRLFAEEHLSRKRMIDKTLALYSMCASDSSGHLANLATK